MSVSNLLGKQSPQYSALSETAYKTYVPGGVKYVSRFYATAGPAPPVPALGILPGLANVIGGNVNEGRFVRLIYTKVGFNVTIRFEAFKTLTADVGNPIKDIHVLADGRNVSLTLNALDQQLLDQIINDIGRRNPIDGVVTPVEILLPGISSNLTVADQINVLRISNVGLLAIERTSGGNLLADNDLELGAASFVSENNIIL